MHNRGTDHEVLIGEIETVEQACKAAEAQKADGKDGQTGKLQRKYINYSSCIIGVITGAVKIQRFATRAYSKDGDRDCSREKTDPGRSRF